MPTRNINLIASQDAFVNTKLNLTSVLAPVYNIEFHYRTIDNSRKTFYVTPSTYDSSLEFRGKIYCDNNIMITETQLRPK